MDDRALMEKARVVLDNCRSFYVLFSGGKDSLATLLWVMENVNNDNWKILYTEVTGNTSPLCTEYVRKICNGHKKEVNETLGAAHPTRRLNAMPFPLFPFSGFLFCRMMLEHHAEFGC